MDAFDKKIGVSVASIGRAVEGVGKKDVDTFSRACFGRGQGGR